MTDDRTIFKIPETNYAAFEHQIAKLSRKAQKLIGEAIVPKIVGQTFEKDASDEPFLVYDVYLDAPVAIVAGYRFIATIDHANEIGNIVRTVPNCGIALPEKYRTIEPHCDHCGINRYRRDTYVVCCEATGDIKQVGSTCLQDFFGHDPMAMARFAELLGLADECAHGAENDEGRGGSSDWISLERFMTHVSAMIRLFGWVSVGMSQTHGGVPTKLTAILNMFEREPARRIATTDEDRATAIAAIEWARELSGELSDYEHNVKVTASSEYIKDRSTGIAASIIPAFNRSIVAKKNSDDSVSTHLGNIKEKITVNDCTVTYVNAFESDYGWIHIYIFKDAVGNVVKWKASSNQNLSYGDVVNVIGTVKDHADFKGIKQTVLTRCKLTVVKKALEKEAVTN